MRRMVIDWIERVTHSAKFGPQFLELANDSSQDSHGCAKKAGSPELCRFAQHVESFWMWLATCLADFSSWTAEHPLLRH